MSRKVAFSIVFCVVVAAICLAQDFRGNLGGTVLDSSGAVVPGVEVKAVNVDTGVTAIGSTNEAGKFTIRFLLPGTYRLIAEKPGFKTYSQDKVSLRINDKLDITIRLEIGSIAETVEVRAGTPLLETASGTIGQVMDERRMLELPQKGGNPLELQRLVPGVVNLTNVRTMKSSSPSGTSQSSVNGTGTNQTLFNIDGVSNSSNDGGGGKLRVAFIPPSSAIVGFKMESNPYDASVGHVFGPVINITTKGGANEPHGSVYYWAKNSAFDAMNFFSNKAGLGKLVYQDHRYGASVGGPVVLPHLYDGRNKTFFFYSWEQNRWSSPANQNQFATVPTAAERTGDFSALLGCRQPVSDLQPVHHPGGHQREVPARSHPGQYHSQEPAQQRGPEPGARSGRYQTSPAPSTARTTTSTPTCERTLTIRTWRVSIMPSAPITACFCACTNTSLKIRRMRWAFRPPRRSSITTSGRWPWTTCIVLSPNLVLNLRYGITNAEYLERRVTQGTDLAALGFSPSLTRLVDPRQATVPRVKVGSYATLSDWSDGDGGNTALTHSWFADLTKLKGSHALRFGADFRVCCGRSGTATRALSRRTSASRPHTLVGRWTMLPPRPSARNSRPCFWAFPRAT